MARVKAADGRHWFRLSSVLAVSLALAGCGNGKCEIPGNGPTSQARAPQAPGQPAQAPVQQVVASDLHIDDYGPHEAKAGEPFNRQPDGASAAWFRLNKSVEGSLVNVHLNNVVIKGDISGAMVTVRVPDNLHAAEGRITVSVDKVDGDSVSKSNAVDIVVSKP